MLFISFFNVATGKFLNSFAVCIGFLLDSTTLNPFCLGPYGKLVPQIWAQGRSVLDYSKLDTSLLADAITFLRGDLIGTFYSFSRRFNLLGYKSVAQGESDLKNPPFSHFSLFPLFLSLLFFSASSFSPSLSPFFTFTSFLSLTNWPPYLSHHEERNMVSDLSQFMLLTCSHLVVREREKLSASVSEVSLLTPQEGADRPDHGHVTPCASQLPERVSPCLFLLKRVGDETRGKPKLGARAGQPASKKACKPEVS